jgi:EAL domain-containing protein (putative c-di-GMP-specific phosphodiesterase class I)/ActR/RegA family two-component response regulator
MNEDREMPASILCPANPLNLHSSMSASLDYPDYTNEQNRVSILIVDDAQNDLELLSLLLRRQGYEVRIALNGLVALAEAEADPPDLILLAVYIPGIDGYTVCNRLKSNEKTSEIPVLFISEIDDPLDKIEAFSVGGLDYINKPFQVLEVLARVETHLRLRFLQLQLQEQARILENQNRDLQRQILALRRVDKSLHPALRAAIANREMYLKYQPIFELETSRIRGFEALLRWHHPDFGEVSPLDFIPLAETMGLIEVLGEWAISQACHDLGNWLQQVPHAAHLTMSINISSRQIDGLGLLQLIERVLHDNQISPANLNFEVTESALMTDPDYVCEILRKLKNLGIRLCVDDFGTGYSSLKHLHHFPIDTLKIDRSFVSQEEWAVVNAIIMMADALGIGAIAEGIETPAQLHKLKSLACKQGQGFYLTEPLEAIAASKLILKNLGSTIYT